MTRAQSIYEEALVAIEKLNDSQALLTLKAHYLGKKGVLNALLKNLGNLPNDERKREGQILNLYKTKLLDQFKLQEQVLANQALAIKMQAQALDISLPGRGHKSGALHPVIETMNWISHYFQTLGFDLKLGPEIEDDYHNFAALNIPVHHPARNMHDTFYFNPELLLRTHTSPVQIRNMQASAPPYKMVTPGKVYRYDLDATHSPQFHQIEVLLVDKDINFGHLKYLLTHFLNNFFGCEKKIRFRPSYFPFTEPSVEIDILDEKNGSWLEVLGGGLVHPQVLKNCDLDTEIYSGLAFGMGVERLCMLKYGISDLRLFLDNDMRFLNQFKSL